VRPKNVGDYQYVIKYILPSSFFDLLYRGRKNSMSILREVIGGTKIKNYFQGTVCWRYVLAVLMGLTEVGNQAKLLKYYEKKKLYFV
jgi:hypothetical protein